MPRTLLFVPSVILGLSILGSGLACNRANTAIGREASARPRIEQVALSSAMEAAYNKVNFSFCKDQKCFVETKALSKSDIDFITSYVTKKVLEAGGIPVLQEQNAKLKLTSTLDVSGTDEVRRAILRDLIVAEFKGTLAVVDLDKGAVQKMIELNAVTQSKRNKGADTNVISK